MWSRDKSESSLRRGYIFFANYDIPTFIVGCFRTSDFRKSTMLFVFALCGIYTREIYMRVSLCVSGRPPKFRTFPRGTVRGGPDCKRKRNPNSDRRVYNIYRKLAKTRVREIAIHGPNVTRGPNVPVVKTKSNVAKVRPHAFESLAHIRGC